MTFDPELWGMQVFGEYYTNKIANSPNFDTPTKKFAGKLNTYLNAVGLFSDLNEIWDHPYYPDDMKGALTILVILHEFGPTLYVDDLPMTYAQAWDLVNTVPPEFGGGTKEEFWEKLHEQFPDTFQLDPNGSLIPPSNLPNEPPENPPSDVAPGRDELPNWEPAAQAPFDTANLPIGSPLILDLDGDGVELTSFNAATTDTFFDIDGDSFAEQTAWLTANQDGLLVRDINDNGQIDGVGELFGSPTIDGFALLATLDDNGDHLIDQYDDSWADLLIWKDVNGDAATQSGELITLASLNIVSIDLAGIAASTSTISGNPISHTSTFKFSNGTTRSIVDAWFTHDNVNTFYTGDYTLDVRTLSLPTLRGFGELPDLHIAMSQDEGLLEMVQDLSASFSFESFDPANGWNEAVTDILYRWAGVDAVNPTSRGPNVADARGLEFLEEFFGEEYQQGGVFANPVIAAAILLDQSWTIVFENLRAQLLVQSGAAALFTDDVTYNLVTGEIDGDMELSEAAIINLEDFATDTGVDTEEFWIEVARFLDATKGFDNLTVTENGWLNTSIFATDPGLTWTEIKDLIDIDNGGATINGTGGNDTLTGTTHGESIYGASGNDTIDGAAGDDTLYGDGGNDTIHGGAGQDELNGGADNDTLDGGSGGDIVYGGNGNDTYVYTSGEDVYDDVSGTDIVLLPSGITSGDVTFYRLEDDPAFVRSLFIVVGTLGTIELTDHFASNGNVSGLIETLTFADTSTYDLSSFSTLVSYGGEGNDNIWGGTGNRVDILYGMGGDDYLYGGYGGDDTLDGGVGNDTLNGELGNDTYIASPGFDIIMEAGGTDTIQMPASVTAGDISFLRLNSNANDLQITVDGLGQIIVDNFFVSSSYAVEQVVTTGATITLSSMSVETVGTSGNDTMYGITASASTNDVFDGREGNDTMSGGAGNDIYYFSPGQDVVSETTSSTNDRVKFWDAYSPGDISVYRGGYQGRDLIFADQNGNTLNINSHFYNVQSQIEYAEFSNSTVWTISSMEIETRGTSGNDTFFDYDIGDASTDDTIYGYGGNDQLHGGSGTNYIYGGDGNDNVSGGNDVDYLYGDDGTDSLSGGNGNDFLYGGSGNDTINGGGNDDFIEGGSGDDAINGGGINGGIDTITYANASGAVTVSLATTSAQNTGGDGTDTISYVENLIGSAYSDTLTGSTGDNTIKGGAGDDAISGGSGNDILHGGYGTDTMTGGANTDTFVFELLSAFTNQDTVTDFSTAQNDKIDIGNVIEEFNPLTDAIANWVNFTNSGADSIMSIDRDGTGVTYGFVDVVTLNGVNNLDETTLYNNGSLLAA